jgi:archaetidylinositol phosphate synthase
MWFRALEPRNCRAIPRFITPDWLTAFGAAGAVIAFIGYAATGLDPSFFWMATLGVVIHWFGDSLDGSLARYRQIERPRYGYFVDFSVDAICCFLIMLGVGFSAYVRLDVALFALVGYYMLWMYVLLNCQVSRNLQLSFLAAGPTEFRIVLIGLNCWMYFAGGLTMQAGPAIVSPYDLAFCGMGIVSISLFVFNVFTVARRLRLEDALQNRGGECESQSFHKFSRILVNRIRKNWGVFFEGDRFRLDRLFYPLAARPLAWIYRICF